MALTLYYSSLDSRSLIIRAAFQYLTTLTFLDSETSREIDSVREVEVGLITPILPVKSIYQEVPLLVHQNKNGKQIIIEDWRQILRYLNEHILDYGLIPADANLQAAVWITLEKLQIECLPPLFAELTLTSLQQWRQLIPYLKLYYSDSPLLRIKLMLIYPRYLRSISSQIDSTDRSESLLNQIYINSDSNLVRWICEQVAANFRIFLGS